MYFNLKRRMCSVNPSSLMMEDAAHVLTGAPCRKCLSTPAKVVLQRKFPYCKECFEEFFAHKYRSTLGKSKLMKHGDRVLVAFSGSHSSICLLNLIKHSANDDTRRKKIYTETEVVFIDDLDLANVNPDERNDILREINRVVGLMGYCLHVVPLMERMDNLVIHDIDICQDSSNERQVKFSTMSVSSQMDFVGKLRLRILHQVAEKLKCNKIFLADTSDHVAINIIANISLGRGSQLPNDIGFCDRRFEINYILRPLIECSKKEVLFYNRFKGLPSITVPDLSTKRGNSISIQKLTEQFITNLGENFPSTVSTVVSTGAKLVNDENSSGPRCPFCQACVDFCNPVSAQEASRISSLISNLGPGNFDPSTMSSKERCHSEISDCSELGNNSFLNSLCYGCRRIAREADGVDFIRQVASFQTMRNEINDFLL